MAKRYKITILFKSGHSIQVSAKEFQTLFDGDELTRLTWVDMRPQQLFISVSDIESIWVK